MSVHMLTTSPHVFGVRPRLRPDDGLGELAVACGWSSALCGLRARIRTFTSRALPFSWASPGRALRCSYPSRADPASRALLSLSTLYVASACRGNRWGVLQTASGPLTVYGGALHLRDRLVQLWGYVQHCGVLGFWR